MKIACYIRRRYYDAVCFLSWSKRCFKISFFFPLTINLRFYKIRLVILISTNFDDLISIRIAIGSGTAFIVAQLLDVEIFQILRSRKWFVAPITSSFFGSIIDTFLFFSISFYGTDIPWFSLAIGDLLVKFFIAFLMLVPYRLLIFKIKDISDIRKNRSFI